MTPAIKQFIVNEQPFTAIENSGLTIHRCDFTLDGYDDRFFSSLGIDYPATLNRAVNKRKAEFLAGRHCANTVLAALNIHDFVIHAGKNRAPQWPAEIKGSITHSNSTALAAVTASADVLGVGIDIETIISTKTMNNTKGMILHGNDGQWLEQPGVTPEMVFSLIFSIKESFFKAAYPSTGYYFDFDTVSITALDFVQNRFTLTLHKDLNPKLTPGLVFSGDFRFIDGQVLSLLVL